MTSRVLRAAKWIGACGALTFGGLVVFGHTDPRWTQRKFDIRKCPPLLHEQPPSREACLAQLSSHGSLDSPLDVLVVGGGCVGTGIALDAVTRGLQVGLVEGGDYAGQTSSRSTKLIHGGIRYLEKAVYQLDLSQLKLVAEALRERTIMLHQAPHLCNSLPTILPCYSLYETGTYWMGAKLYDLIASVYGGTIAYSSYMPLRRLHDRHPALRDHDGHQRKLLGAVRYFDGQMNDARLCYSVAMTAACYGAATANYTTVTRLEHLVDEAGEPVVKATMRDHIADREITVFTRSVVNAAGPFATQVERLSTTPANHIDVTPALGTHIVLDRRYAPRLHEAMVVPSPDGRVVFTIPWLGGCLVGTTDHRSPVTNDPRPPRTDVEFLLKSIEPYVGTVPLSDVKSVWAGIRALATPTARTGGGGDTQNIVREHVITVDEANRLVSVAGGKWTTYREMARQATDTLLDTLLKARQAQMAPCCTEEIVMLGARHLDTVPAAPETTSAIPADVHHHWRGNYGDRYNDIANIALKDGHKYLRRIVENSPVTEAEVIWAANNEHCERVADFICRRTRMAFVDAAQAEAAIPRVADLMAQEKHWTDARLAEELKSAKIAMQAFQPADA